MRETKYHEYDALIHSTIMLSNRHFRDTDLFLNALGDNIRMYFFNMISTEDFKNQLDELKSDLPMNYTIPEVTIFEMIEICKITVTKNSTYVQINVEIPIFLKENTTFFELIPIPTSSGNVTNILNYNSLHYFINDDTIKIVPFYEFENCIKLENLTICNTIALSSIEQPDDCLYAIIKEGTMNHCLVKEIAHKNYIMETSMRSVFCYIVNPVAIKIACNERNFVHKMNKSNEIIYDAECDVYEVTNTIMSNTTDLKTIEINFLYFKPNFSYYDNTLQNWTYNISQINKRDIDLLESISETHNLILKLYEAKQMNSSDVLKPFTDFFNELSIPKWILKMFLIYVLLPLIILKLVLCCCSRLKRFSFSE